MSWACPWAHRTLIYRKLKGLEDAIGVTAVEPLMLEDGWTLAEGADDVNGARFLWQVYAKAEPHYTGRVTVPVLWDREQNTIVNNEFRRNHPPVRRLAGRTRAAAAPAGAGGGYRRPQ